MKYNLLVVAIHLNSNIEIHKSKNLVAAASSADSFKF